MFYLACHYLRQTLHSHNEMYKGENTEERSDIQTHASEVMFDHPYTQLGWKQDFCICRKDVLLNIMDT